MKGKMARQGMEVRGFTRGMDVGRNLSILKGCLHWVQAGALKLGAGN